MLIVLHSAKTNTIHISNRRWDPVTATSSAYMGTASGLLTSATDIVVRPYETYKQRLPSNPNGGQTVPGLDGHQLIHNSSELTRPGNKAGMQSTPGSSNASGTNNGLKVAGDMAAASGISFAMMTGNFAKGLFVDIPFATAEGFRATPALYGEKPSHYGTITGIRSGSVVAGKAFTYGMAEGLADMVMLPYKGAIKDGARGCIKGLGKGTMNLASKAASGAIGLYAYPCHGVAQTIEKAMYTARRKKVESAKMAEGKWIMETKELADPGDIVKRFDELMSTRK